jgi:hypothetical protein
MAPFLIKQQQQRKPSFFRPTLLSRISSFTAFGFPLPKLLVIILGFSLSFLADLFETKFFSAFTTTSSQATFLLEKPTPRLGIFSFGKGCTRILRPMPRPASAANLASLPPEILALLLSLSKLFLLLSTLGSSICWALFL